MQKKHLVPLFILVLFFHNTSYSQLLQVLEKTKKKTFPDVEQPSLHVAPAIFYRPAVIFLNPYDSIKENVYWRRNFTDQFLETYTDLKIYPASRIFGFIQDSIYFRSTPYDDYNIFAPQIFSGPIDLYYTRYIQNLGEIRMVSMDSSSQVYHNNMIITGDVPRRYANEYTYFVTFPWDTLKMIPVTRESLPGFAKTYLRTYPDAYKEAMKYTRSTTSQVLSYTLLPVAVAGTAAFVLVQGNPVYFIAIGVGALVTYVAVKIFLKPKMLNPEAMMGIIGKCR
jgi:hypothetical protein